VRNKKRESILKTYQIALILILIISAFLRLTQLGYSNFYGDETKALYYKKNVSAIEHFLNQRKGPGQFLIAWSIETVTGSYNELSTRLPSAIAGILSVYVLYLLTKNLFNKKVALISALFFSLNGLYIAFSRILQYQIHYVFFGLLSLYLLTEYYKKHQTKILLLSALSTGAAFLFHYDAIFFLVPVLIYILHQDKDLRKNFKVYFKKYLIPLGLVVGVYYLPYLIFGAFRHDTLPYLLTRVVGKDLRPSSNLYTINFYNPLYLSFVYLAFSILSLKKIEDKKVQILLIWFLVPFTLFQLVFKSSGTHIHNFILPLIILSAIGMEALLTNKVILTAFVTLLGGLTLAVQSVVFIPFLNKGYPWKDTKILGIRTPKLRQDLQVFAYGFPYYRNWDEIADYLNLYDPGSHFYTNDNTTIAEFYLRDFKLHNGRKTMFFVDVNNNQLGNNLIDQRYLDTSAYYPAKDFYHNGNVTATVYLRHSRNRF